MDESCIQVAIYDDHLEVTSPGGLYNGLTYEEITSAYVNLLDEEDKEHQRILCELIRTLYKTVPLYSLKGHTRTELEEESQEARFHVIQGGKE